MTDIQTENASDAASNEDLIGPQNGPPPNPR